MVISSTSGFVRILHNDTGRALHTVPIAWWASLVGVTADLIIKNPQMLVFISGWCLLTLMKTILDRKLPPSANRRDHKQPGTGTQMGDGIIKMGLSQSVTASWLGDLLSYSSSPGPTELGTGGTPLVWSSNLKSNTNTSNDAQTVWDWDVWIRDAPPVKLM